MRASLFIIALALAGCGKSTEIPAAQNSAAAQDAAPAAATFAGTWGKDAAQCAAPQDSMEAPLILTEAGYDEHESHCDFTTVTSAGPGAWSVKGRCSVEGDEQDIAMDIAVRGDMLITNPGKNQNTLIRCQPRHAPAAE